MASLLAACCCGPSMYYRLFYCGDDTYSGLTLTTSAAAGHLADTFRRTADDVCYYIHGTTTVQNDAGGGTWYADCAACETAGGGAGGGGCDPTKISFGVDENWNFRGTIPDGEADVGGAISSSDGGELCVNSRNQIYVTVAGTFVVLADTGHVISPACNPSFSIYLNGASVAGPYTINPGTPVGGTFAAVAGDRIQIYVEHCTGIGDGARNGYSSGYHDDWPCRSGVAGCLCDTDDPACCPGVDAFSLPSSVQYGPYTLTYDVVSETYKYESSPGLVRVELAPDDCCGWVLRDTFINPGLATYFVKGWECDPTGTYYGEDLSDTAVVS